MRRQTCAGQTTPPSRQPCGYWGPTTSHPTPTKGRGFGSSRDRASRGHRRTPATDGRRREAQWRGAAPVVSGCSLTLDATANTSAQHRDFHLRSPPSFFHSCSGSPSSNLSDATARHGAHNTPARSHQLSDQTHRKRPSDASRQDVWGGTVASGKWARMGRMNPTTAKALLRRKA